MCTLGAGQAPVGRRRCKTGVPRTRRDREGRGGPSGLASTRLARLAGLVLRRSSQSTARLHACVRACRLLTAQRLHQADGLLEEQVGADALEGGVVLLPGGRGRPAWRMRRAGPAGGRAGGAEAAGLQTAAAGSSASKLRT